jgi:O2-independent ubiquinone biosynthesis accessory factor UbiT
LRAQNSAPPPLSPVLLAGLPLRMLPLTPIQLALNALMAVISDSHPDVFERLTGIDDPTFLIEPVDLPVVFILRARSPSPSLIVMPPGDARTGNIKTTIRGPLLALLALLEGRTDGDALFFSRDLVIEGDTEAVVALRNAVDDAEVDVVGDVLAAAGPLSAPARLALELLQRAFHRASTDMRVLHDAILEPALRRIEGQARAQQDLERQFNDLGRRARSARTRTT